MNYFVFRFALCQLSYYNTEYLCESNQRYWFGGCFFLRTDHFAIWNPCIYNSHMYQSPSKVDLPAFHLMFPYNIVPMRVHLINAVKMVTIKLRYSTSCWSFRWIELWIRFQNIGIVHIDLILSLKLHIQIGWQQSILNVFLVGT